MAKIILFSDLHAHAFKPYATILPNGLNSRLADTVNCIAQIYDYAKSISADAVLFGGDLFHIRKTISVAAFNAVYEQMAKFSFSKIPVAMIHGNHDQADREGNTHSIHAFRTFLHVIDKPCWYPLVCRSGEIIYLLGVPYIENIPQLQELTHSSCPNPDASRLLLGHLGIQGARIGADFVYTNPHDATVEDLNATAFDAVFLGHYHSYQQLASNAWYIGAPLHHNWGDRNDTRGFIVYDTDTKQHQHVPLKFPKFVELTEFDLSTTCTDAVDGFVRLVSDAKWTEKDHDALRTKLGARSLEISTKKSSKVFENHAPRIAVNPADSSDDILEKYVLSGLGTMDGLDEGYLIQLGREILTEVE
jgi:DNA repair exonuclease SbcCD nuclease subunit